MSALHAGDHFTEDITGTDLTVVAIVDHTRDAIGSEVIKALGPDGQLWFWFDGRSILCGLQ
jgi:hypothetical protein